MKNTIKYAMLLAALVAVPAHGFGLSSSFWKTWEDTKDARAKVVKAVKESRVIQGSLVGGAILVGVGIYFMLPKRTASEAPSELPFLEGLAPAIPGEGSAIPHIMAPAPEAPAPAPTQTDDQVDLRRHQLFTSYISPKQPAAQAPLENITPAVQLAPAPAGARNDFVHAIGNGVNALAQNLSPVLEQAADTTVNFATEKAFPAIQGATAVAVPAIFNAAKTGATFVAQGARQTVENASYPNTLTNRVLRGTWSAATFLPVLGYTYAADRVSGWLNRSTVARP